jgi:hypothetical protein
MNKFKFYFILSITTLALFSCSKKKEDEVIVTPPRDYAVQYTSDNAAIVTYLKTHSVTVKNNPGFIDDQDVTFTEVSSGSSQSMWVYNLDNSSMPLLKKAVTLNGVNYEIYYIKLRQGSKPLSRPSNVDGVFAAYKGSLLDGTVFDFSNYQQTLYNFDGSISSGGIPVIEGWKEIFPQFNTGTITDSNANDGTLVYNDFGAGIMFLPSGLAYYSEAKGKIPAYSPLIFSFKLYEVKRYDHDGDGIPSYLEDLDGDNYMRVLAKDVVNPDDKDKDGIPNFLDADDDEDNYTTRFEITGSNGVLYPFASIPDCSGNTIDLDRTKKHLDKNCH